jgi:hypothetical protein
MVHYETGAAMFRTGEEHKKKHHEIPCQVNQDGLIEHGDGQISKSIREALSSESLSKNGTVMYTTGPNKDKQLIKRSTKNKGLKIQKASAKAAAPRETYQAGTQAANNLQKAINGWVEKEGPIYKPVGG